MGSFHHLDFLGMGAGTIIFAPLSEVIGRRLVYLTSMALFLLLILPSTLADNIEAILISRLVGGLFGSAIMGNSPASVNDIVSDQHRALAFWYLVHRTYKWSRVWSDYWRLCFRISGLEMDKLDCPDYWRRGSCLNVLH